MRSEEHIRQIAAAAQAKESLHAICDKCTTNVVLLLHTPLPTDAVPYFSSDVLHKLGGHCSNCRKTFCFSCSNPTAIALGNCPICKAPLYFASNQDMLNSDTPVCEFIDALNARRAAPKRERPEEKPPVGGGNPEHIARIVAIADVTTSALQESIKRGGADWAQSLMKAGTDCASDWDEWCKTLPAPPDLRGLDLSNRILANLHFRGANLAGARFSQSRFFFCSFRGANLEGADFSGATLGMQESFVGANLRNANFSNAKLCGVYADDSTDLTGANFTKASLAASNMQPVDSFKARLSKEQKKQMSSCFIATACYGDYDAKEVRILRHFRDNTLLKSARGQRAVDLYYRASPPFAQWLELHPIIAALIRTMVLTPMTRLVGRMQK